MEWLGDNLLLQILFLVVVGIVTGFINTVAGGGSLLTLPLLIFMGLSHTYANGTNRVGILFQSIGAASGFRNQKVTSFPLGLKQGVVAGLGAIFGSILAVEIDADVFKRTLAFIIVGVVAVIVVNPKPEVVKFKSLILQRIFSLFGFFIVGIYGGFIQAGVGFLCILVSRIFDRVDLHRANHAKMFATFCISMVAISIFIYHDLVIWSYGIPLALGGVLGAWFAGNYSVRKGEGFVKVFLMVMASAMAVKLFFF